MSNRRSTIDDRRSVLIVSNGHGEDAVGDLLARELAPHARVRAYPLVGLGSAYEGVELLDPRKVLRSGGFALRGSWRGLWRDLREGGFGFWLGQGQTLRTEKGKHGLIVAIGDVYCLWMAALAGRPVIFVATAKSEYNESHGWLERVLIRRNVVAVFARDEPTARKLRKARLPTHYAGNPLMDTIGPDGEPLPGLHPGRPTVALLPGSRMDAYSNFLTFLQLCRRVGEQIYCNFVCTVAPTLDPRQLYGLATRAGWSTTGAGVASGEVEVQVTGAFGAAIRAADVVVGLAGTANEQAAGLGKPVVAFPARGVQYSERFMNLQKRLLGEALVETPSWAEAATVVVRLLRDSKERSHRGTVGKERMGAPGAVRAIAREVVNLLQSATAPLYA